jgi:hypothetical protein
VPIAGRRVYHIKADFYGGFDISDRYLCQQYVYKGLY